MPKSTISLICIVVILLLGSIYYFSIGKNALTINGNHSGDISSSSIKILFNWQDYFKDSQPIKGEHILAKNSQYSLKLYVLNDSIHQTSILTSKVYVNGEEAGEVGGNAVNDGVFSPDNNFYAFRVRSTCGANCNDFTLYAIDLKNLKTIFIKAPITKKDFKDNASELQDKVAKPYIESFTWQTPHTLEIVAYFLGVNTADGKTYQVSPKEVWVYNIDNGVYSLKSTQ